MSEREIAVKVQDLTKSFKIPLEASNGIKQKLINTLKGRKGYRDFTPLNEISFEIKKGDFFGIVGRNGSGKSTLLKTIAGIYTPNKGAVHVNGTLVPFIELGVGFNPELTGRENVFLNGALLGFSRKEMEGMYDDIVDFAELGDFMEERLKNYSSGMQVRLAFSIAIRAKGDILLLDEVLAVGDAVFQKKCFDYFRELKHEQKTVIFVSHDRDALQRFCTNGVLIEEGHLLYAGKIDDILDRYEQILNNDRANEIVNQKTKEGRRKRWGSGDVLIESINAYGNNQKNELLTGSDKTLHVKIQHKFKSRVAAPVYGLIICDQDNNNVFVSNTLQQRKDTADQKAGDYNEMLWEIPNVFPSGKYSISPAVANSDGTSTYDWINEAVWFEVSRPINNIATVYVDHKISEARGTRK